MPGPRAALYLYLGRNLIGVMVGPEGENWKLTISGIGRRMALAPTVKDATEQHRADSDPLGRFLAACTQQVDDPKARVQSSALYEVFVAWARANGECEWTQTGLGKALRERGFVNRHSNNMWWLGLKLTKAASDFVDDSGEPCRQRGAARCRPAPDGRVPL